MEDFSRCGESHLIALYFQQPEQKSKVAVLVPKVVLYFQLFVCRQGATTERCSGVKQQLVDICQPGGQEMHSR